MIERACQFGEGRYLAGIVTEPEGTPRGDLLLINAGLTPKAGPFRLYAELARRLARDGWRTMRFDLGGIGDSPQLEGRATLRERTSVEIKAAIDSLRASGATGPLWLAGLCSGAEDAFLQAEGEPRCGGVLMIDPFAYRTPGFRWRNLLPQAAKGALSAVGLYSSRAAPGSTGPAPSPELVDYEYLAQPVAERILRRLLARGARLHFVYTGGMSERFNHPAQLQEMFAGVPLEGAATVDHLPRLGHTQLLTDDRAQLIETIARRMRDD